MTQSNSIYSFFAKENMQAPSPDTSASHLRRMWIYKMTTFLAIGCLYVICCSYF